MHSGGTKVEVNAKFVQDFSASYHFILTERVSYRRTIANCGRWIKFGHFETHVTFTAGRKNFCHAVETGFLACVFLRCCTAFVVIKVELAPESNNVFKVAYVSFSCFTFNSAKVIGIKVTGQFSVFYVGGFSGK